MNLSYWEIKTWLANVDFTIIGSGIVGISCAIQLRHRFPSAKILILEKGMLPQGASTKNAGFACFGSLSEIIDDLKTHSRQETIELIKQRVTGLQLLRKTLGDKTIDYRQFGGYEVFNDSDNLLYSSCLEQQETINKLVFPVFKESVFSIKENTFGFHKIKKKISFNKFEGQINTGKMMQALIDKASNLRINILNNCSVESFTETSEGVCIKTKNFEFKTRKVFIATNGFASQFIKDIVTPARAQVIITKPISKLSIKGTFHLDKGYYYFRNINNRILLGGGRNLDFKGEETTSFGRSALIQDHLEDVLKRIILPHQNFEIEYRWSGIMGVGKQKKPVLKQLSNNVYCGVRLGGMGVAIGSAVGRDLADLLA
ncbi:FAD-binding oxidoreductase [Flavobacteriaceae bacterium]|jgi:gamma-glutamylputrescine oxidase|nr:FAD-binding oxidoreductase [Flavobacteriaceae bacterium]